MEEEKVGMVIKYFSKPGVAAIELTEGTLHIKDSIHIMGHTTDFEQEIGSMQVDNASVEEAGIGSSIGIKVKERVRPHDAVFRIKE